MDFDAWIANGPGRDGQSQALQERKIYVHVEPLSLTPGEAVGDNLESLSDRIEMIEALLQTEIAQIAWMTMRSKQWYTKTSRLPNSRVNRSIGCHSTRSVGRRKVEPEKHQAPFRQTTGRGQGLPSIR